MGVVEGWWVSVIVMEQMLGFVMAGEEAVGGRVWFWRRVGVRVRRAVLCRWIGGREERVRDRHVCVVFSIGSGGAKV